MQELTIQHARQTLPYPHALNFQINQQADAACAFTIAAPVSCSPEQLHTLACPSDCRAKIACRAEPQQGILITECDWKKSYHLHGGRRLHDIPEAIAGYQSHAALTRLKAQRGTHKRLRAQAQVLILEELVSQAPRQVQAVQAVVVGLHADADVCTAHLPVIDRCHTMNPQSRLSQYELLLLLTCHFL